MLPASAREVLASGTHLAHLVTRNPDGSPQVSCVWVGLDGEAVEISTPVSFRVEPLALRVLVPHGNLRQAEARRSRDVSVGKLLRVARGVEPGEPAPNPIGAIDQTSPGPSRS